MICTLTLVDKEDGLEMNVDFGGEIGGSYAQDAMRMIGIFADNLLKGSYPDELVAGIMSVGRVVENDD